MKVRHVNRKVPVSVEFSLIEFIKHVLDVGVDFEVKLDGTNIRLVGGSKPEDYENMFTLTEDKVVVSLTDEDAEILTLED